LVSLVGVSQSVVALAPKPGRTMATLGLQPTMTKMGTP
jgi:hypothetical protein